MSGEVGVGQTYAISKAISFPRLKKKGWQNGSESESIFLNFGAHFVLADMCDAVFVSDVGAVCLFGFCFCFG